MIGRLDLDGLGSPAVIAAKIHELITDMPAEVPLEQLCALLGIISIEDINADGFEAALIMDELKASGAILLASGRSQQRRRFSIAHELGHFLIPTHRPKPDRPFSCSLEDLHRVSAKDRDRRRRIEAEANRFAAHLLMPPKLIRARMGQEEACLETIVSMARDLNVSKEAMARAWVDASREPVAVVIAKGGLILRQYRSEDFPWLRTNKSDQLPQGSFAADYIAPPGEYSNTEEIDADIWLGERDAARVLLLTEQVVAQQQKYVMILLLAELDEDE
ncbi:hypothetical protein HME9302_00103 [Alteripontixanthobacter maritimus]|uniref:IrrE N-terminal-like domain-containing protein n=1 Tax=Alteripontixanthobacter maritimus TaxID=2161824 RepID=A0A369Q6I9_9SPHN|nr:ImmA/IrrE family metallo-endopeptidase [Alteripontixanthobacter maritimus]RDC58927.1 hypothetical protein HME9302_00103 [Alteripontixanthobacter maritimus]